MVLLRGRRIARASLAGALAFSAAGSAVAQESEPAPRAIHSSAKPPADRLSLTARSETHLQFFQRALLPGPNGAIVSEDTALPITEYVTVDARNVDAPWQKDGLHLEFSAWGQLWPT
jgi:hypothetical protein